MSRKPTDRARFISLVVAVAAVLAGAALLMEIPLASAEEAECVNYLRTQPYPSADGAQFTVTWESRNGANQLVQSIGRLRYREFGQTGWWETPPEASPRIQHSITHTGVFSQMYEFQVMNDYDFDGLYCEGLTGTVTTDPMPPPCYNPVFNITEASTTSSFTITFQTLEPTRCHLSYSRVGVWLDPTTTTPDTPLGTNHTITANNLSSGTEYAYSIYAYCPDTYNYQGEGGGTVTTGTGGGGGGKYPKPMQPVLSRVWPSPAPGNAWIRFVMPREGRVSVDVFDVRGRLIRNVARGGYPAGDHDVRWDGRTTSGDRARAGVYFIRLSSDARTSTKRIMILPAD